LKKKYEGDYAIFLIACLIYTLGKTRVCTWYRITASKILTVWSQTF